MRHSLLLLSLTGAIAATAASASPIASGGGYSPNSGTGITNASIDTGHAYRKHMAVLALAREGKELQEADGGTLTAAHQAWLQAKLDAIKAGNY